MNAKWGLVTAAVLCLLVAVQAGFAQPQERPARQARAAGAGIGAGMFEGLDLTQEQQAKLAEIRQAMMEKNRNADSAEARREVFAQMREKMQGVLTEEQRAKMRQRGAAPADRDRPVAERPAARGDQERPSPEARVRSMDPLQLFDAVAPRLELTREQQAKVTKLREEAIKKLMQDIRAVLTDAQKERLGQAQERLRRAQAQPRSEAAVERTARSATPRPRREAAERERPERAAGNQRQRER